LQSLHGAIRRGLFLFGIFEFRKASVYYTWLVRYRGEAAHVSDRSRPRQHLDLSVASPRKEQRNPLLLVSAKQGLKT
jgi:hypothetical protein